MVGRTAGACTEAQHDILKSYSKALLLLVRHMAHLLMDAHVDRTWLQEGAG